MCDEHTLNDDRQYLRNTANLSRRQFSQLAAGTALAMMLPLAAGAENAEEILESDVMVTTPDGEADCYFVHPATGRHAAVLVWPDVLGLRPAFREMGRRLAQSGYAVLVVNSFYRSARAPVVPEGATFQDEGIREIVMPLARQLSPATYVADARAFVEFLDNQPAVDAGRPIGTIGYCMGGPIVMHSAAALPDRIGAVGSFHASNLVTESEDSPHRQIPSMRAQVLVAIAENDHEKEPETKDTLIKSFAEAGLTAEVEVYEDALHGWCVVDSPVYHQAQAERAWSRMLALFEAALARRDETA